MASRRQTRPSHRRVEPRGQSLHERVEASRAQNPVQSLVEGMPPVPRQIRRRHPHRLLRTVVAGRTHRHARQCRTCDRRCRSLDADFYHGLLGKRAKSPRRDCTEPTGRSPSKHPRPTQGPRAASAITGNVLRTHEVYVHWSPTVNGISMRAHNSAGSSECTDDKS